MSESSPRNGNVPDVFPPEAVAGADPAGARASSVSETGTVPRQLVPPTLAAPRDDEYRVMRATIAQRGTVRMLLAPITIFCWAATAIATAAVITVAISTLVPLLVLAAGFEAIYALHINVERIGRYLQVFHERDGGWEHVAMAFGQRFPGTAPDPLFSRLFVIAVSVNYLPVALGGETTEMVVLAVLHLLFIARVRVARQTAATQRARDLERFEALFQAARPGSPPA